MENFETGLVPLTLVISLLDDNIASRFPDFLEWEKLKTVYPNQFDFSQILDISNTLPSSI